MYHEPPQNIISLHEFYEKALSRLQVLKKIEFNADANKDNAENYREIIKMTKDHRFALHIPQKQSTVSTNVVTDKNQSGMMILSQDRQEFR